MATLAELQFRRLQKVEQLNLANTSLSEITESQLRGYENENAIVGNRQNASLLNITELRELIEYLEKEIDKIDRQILNLGYRAKHFKLRRK